MIRPLNENDREAWLNLAGEVEPLFGPMLASPDFNEAISTCIANNDAWGIENEEGEVAGIMALDRSANEISWLAVAKRHRGNNYGDMLVKKAIMELDAGGDIHVQTFASGVDEGKAARAVYERNGFVHVKNAGPNPAGIETVILARKK